MNTTLEYISCNACGRDDYKILFDMNPFKIVRCNNCSLIFVNPRLKENDIKEIYQNGYFKNNEFFSSKQEKLYGYYDYEEERFNVEIMYGKILKKIDKFISTGNLLEIGSAYGYFLNLARKSGWEVSGIELSREAAEYCETKFNISPFVGNLNQYQSEKAFFDVIVTFDVLEHMHNPFETLKVTNNLLKKNGLLVCSVPNAGEWVINLFGDRWEDLKRAQSNEHLYFFSKKTIAQMLTLAGYEILYIKTIGRCFNLYHLSKRLQIYNKPFFSLASKIVQLLKISDLNFYINPGLKLIVFARKQKECK